jgi:hypothetical protein
LLRLSAIFARTTVLFDDSKSGAAVFGDFVTVGEKRMGEKNNRTGELDLSIEKAWTANQQKRKLTTHR